MLKIQKITNLLLLNIFYLLLFPQTTYADLPIGIFKGLGGYIPSSEAESTEKLTKILSNVFGVLILAGGIMFVFYFILGALQWTSSGGKPEKVEKAKGQMTSAAIGLIIVVVSYSISFIVGKVLGIDILAPANYLKQLIP